MLISGLQIHVGRIAQFRSLRANRLMRYATIDPDIERIVAMRGAFWQSEFARERGVVKLKPNIRSVLFDNVRQLANPLRILESLRLPENRRRAAARPSCVGERSPNPDATLLFQRFDSRPRLESISPLLMASSAFVRSSSSRIKNCSTARKMIGVFERQQYGYEC